MTDTETPIEVTQDAHAVAQRIISNFCGCGVTISNNHSAVLAIEELINKATEAQSAEIARLKAENERLRAFANEQIRRWEQYKSYGEDYEEGCEDTLYDVAKDARTALAGESA